MIMDGFWEIIAKRVQELGSHWTSYTVLASFLLYVLGYLTLRFHLTALGIGLDLTVLDERYLFTGARFLIYIIASIPSLIFLVLLVLAPFYFMFVILPLSFRLKLGGYFNQQWCKLLAWWQLPFRLALTGIMFSLLMIQLIMRQCFILTDLLLVDKLPDKPFWLRGLLLANDDGLLSLYFSLLLAGLAISLGVLFALKKKVDVSLNEAMLITLLMLLVFIQVLLIPVNYGILVVDKSLPQVNGLETPRSLHVDEQAWLVWEGSEGKTFLLRKYQGNEYHKSLITIPRAAVKNIEIIEYNRIFQVLFDAPVLAKTNNKESS
jgi:hypothetical protein